MPKKYVDLRDELVEKVENQGRCDGRYMQRARGDMRSAYKILVPKSGVSISCEASSRSATKKFPGFYGT